MTATRRAFYATRGSRRADLWALLHPPYTLWHLSYVLLGAALAPQLDAVRLAGALAAFALGTGVLAHALDEWHDRPLCTRLSGAALLLLSGVAALGVLALTVAGGFVISPWIVPWAAAGGAAAAGYALERPSWLHSTLGFALAWGAFPVLAGYWVQTERLDVEVGVAAAGAALLGAAQRTLSRPARDLRRSARDASLRFDTGAGEQRWSRAQVLATWERPLQLIALAVFGVALGAALTHA